jgi:hypothetical protein
MLPHLKISPIVIIFGCALASPAFASTSLIFNPPGAVASSANAINNNGDVAGFYTDNSGVIHGYLRTSTGVFSMFDAPGATEYGSLSLNDSDIIAGYFLGTNNIWYAYTVSASGTVTIVTPPGAINTYAAFINDSGTIAGHFAIANGTLLGYIMSSDGTFTTFSGPSGEIIRSVGGINANGDTAGVLGNATPDDAPFVRLSDGTIQNIRYEAGPPVMSPGSTLPMRSRVQAAFLRFPCATPASRSPRGSSGRTAR